MARKRFLFARVALFLSGLLCAVSSLVSWLHVGPAVLDASVLGRGPAWLLLVGGFGLAGAAWKESRGLAACLFACVTATMLLIALGHLQAVPSVQGARLFIVPEATVPHALHEISHLAVAPAPGSWLALVALVAGGYGLLRQRAQGRRL